MNNFSGTGHWHQIHMSKHNFRFTVSAQFPDRTSGVYPPPLCQNSLSRIRWSERCSLARSMSTWWTYSNVYQVIRAQNHLPHRSSTECNEMPFSEVLVAPRVSGTTTDIHETIGPLNLHRPTEHQDQKLEYSESREICGYEISQNPSKTTQKVQSKTTKYLD